MRVRPRRESSRSAQLRSSRSSRRSTSRTICSRRSRARSRSSSPPTRRGSCRWRAQAQARLAAQQRESQQQQSTTVVGVIRDRAGGGNGRRAAARRTATWPTSRCPSSERRTSGPGSAPGGFDCSGLVMWAYAQVGVSLPHSSYAQYGYGVPVSRDQLAARRPRVLRRSRSRRDLHRRRAVRPRAAHRRRREDLQPRRELVLRDASSAHAAFSKASPAQVQLSYNAATSRAK